MSIAANIGAANNDEKDKLGRAARDLASPGAGAGAAEGAKKFCPHAALDAAGMAASFLCAVHCAALPLAIAVLPAIGAGFLADARFDWTVLGASASMGGTSLWWGWRSHRRGLVFAPLAAGLALVVAGLMLHREAHGQGGCGHCVTETGAKPDAAAVCAQADTLRGSVARFNGGNALGRRLQSAGGAGGGEISAAEGQGHGAGRHTIFLMLGGISICAAHLMNRRFCRSCRACLGRREREAKV